MPASGRRVHEQVKLGSSRTIENMVPFGRHLPVQGHYGLDEVEANLPLGRRLGMRGRQPQRITDPFDTHPTHDQAGQAHVHRADRHRQFGAVDRSEVGSGEHRPRGGQCFAGHHHRRRVGGAPSRITPAQPAGVLLEEQAVCRGYQLIVQTCVHGKLDTLRAGRTQPWSTAKFRQPLICLGQEAPHGCGVLHPRPQCPFQPADDILEVRDRVGLVTALEQELAVFPHLLRVCACGVDERCQQFDTRVPIPGIARISQVVIHHLPRRRCPVAAIIRLPDDGRAARHENRTTLPSPTGSSRTRHHGHGSPHGPVHPPEIPKSPNGRARVRPTGCRLRRRRPQPPLLLASSRPGPRGVGGCPPSGPT